MLWAVKEVSFDVAPGEVLGIVGKNGAGKSTLLKILSRITSPTSGHARVRGRMGSLLEVGTGFHPELTGRDNIYLNGSILGMDRQYIRLRFDEIVEFAGISRFLDTPVKHYSSGMYLRLAFAVAAHLDAEVLVVDEVLAVGDAEFQKKCLGKMNEVANQGRTILFVSHNLNAIQRMCSRSVLLEDGRLVADGKTHEVLRRYLESTSDSPGPNRWIDLTRAQRSGSREVYVSAMRYTSGNDAVGQNAYPDGRLDFALALVSDARRSVAGLAISLFDQQGTKLVNADTISRGVVAPLDLGRNVIGLRIASLHLNPGVYRLSVRLYDPLARRLLDHVEYAFGLEVLDLQGASLGRKTDGAATCDVDLVKVEE
jgi:ABC-type polysaccharide/polyol phosphate transport system ATPase subunit